MQRDPALASRPDAGADMRFGQAVAESAPRDEGGVIGRAAYEARRVRHGLRTPANWFQLVRFSFVGASGYAINLAVYSTLVEAVEIHYLLAAVIAFCVAVTNNFVLNRYWTFRATDGSAVFQAPRFLTVSLIALGFNLLVLEALVGLAGVHKIVGQAAAILAATPLNFVGNKLWSFRRLTHPPGAPSPAGPTG